MMQSTEHVAFHSHQEFFTFNICLLSDAYGLPTWNRSPDVKFIYKINIQARIEVILEP